MKRFLFIVICMLIPSVAVYASPIEYQTANIQLLKGWDYKLGPKNRAIATFEYFNRWYYGDFFMFTDGTRFDEGGTNIYAEFSPRFSLGKITGQNLSRGPVKDLLLATTLEHGKQGRKTYLYGGGIDLNLKGFKAASVNFYRRDNPDISGATWQATLVWKRPFQVGALQFVAEGFADIAGSEGRTYKPNQSVVPRLLLDIGSLAGMQGDRLYGGIEWQYWHNKAGNRGATESVPQLQLKWVLF
ncbi:MAG: DUF5020 domain-containing protein [Alphaproteobacteria bacterium]|nr:DUF5020 domain-containing protein [Alphaproteobacteria bacterium]